MARQKQTGHALLRWSAAVKSADVQDPLGLGLRGSTRMASQLLHCITTLTPRARYYSFLPWAVYDANKRNPTDKVEDAVRRRERALALGCVSLHEGQSCTGGSVVGSDGAAAWLKKGRDEINLRRIDPFTKTVALNQYYRPLVDLGVFAAAGDALAGAETDEELGPTASDIQLTPLGAELASRLDGMLAGLSGTASIASKQGSCTVKSLTSFASRAGLCEIMGNRAPDRELVRDLLFAKRPMEGQAHPFRRRSLLLTLELCRQFSPGRWLLSEINFGNAVYFGTLAHENSRFRVAIPDELHEIATRWRMFYFHHFMAVALEAMFAWLVTHVGDHGLAGTTIDAMVDGLARPQTKGSVGEAIGVPLPRPFIEMTPAELFAIANVPGGPHDGEASKAFDAAVTVTSRFSESEIERLLRGGEYRESPAGLALAMILLTTSMARYRRWVSGDYDKWLWQMAKEDPRLDLVPPIILLGFDDRFQGRWWTTPFGDLARFTLKRFVADQHVEVSYRKTATGMGEKCLLSIDGDRIRTTQSYTDIGMGNGRFRSAVRLLADLTLIEAPKDVHRLTEAGKSFLKTELAAERARGLS